jgi:hypothetical protein
VLVNFAHSGTALLDPSAVSESALAQAQRLISATHGSILIFDKADGPLRSAASFGMHAGSAGALTPDSRLAASVLERGIAEIVNNYDSDPRTLASERGLKALMVRTPAFRPAHRRRRFLRGG